MRLYVLPSECVYREFFEAAILDGEWCVQAAVITSANLRAKYVVSIGISSGLPMKVRRSCKPGAGRGIRIPC